MKLRDARLCADCDEVYEATGLYSRCPACGSEAFALISRWVPTISEFDRWVDQQKTKGDGDADTSRVPELKETILWRV